MLQKDSAPSNRIFPGYKCFAWNSDGSKIAVCPKNSEIWIFDTQSSPDMTKWTKVDVLKEHYNIVSALDWHPKTNLLLSASVDRGIVVWEFSGSEIRPQMGMIPEQKANLDASWNFRGDKFCVGASTGNVYLARFNANQNFWVANPLKKKPIHKASVTAVKFAPLSGRVVASCSLDGSIALTSAHIPA